MPSTMLRIGGGFDSSNMNGHEAVYDPGILISDEEDNSKNLEEVYDFLQNNKSAIAAIEHSMELDVGMFIYPDHMVMMSATFHPSLLAILSELNIDLKVSSYLTVEDDE